MIRLQLPDGEVREGVDDGLSVADALGIAQDRDWVAAKVDGRLVDLATPLHADAEVELVSADSDQGLAVMRHTAAHLMAQAVRRLFPGTRLAIGPSIEDGFYYDFDIPQALSPDDLGRLEEEMARLVKEDLPIERFELARDEALAKAQQEEEDYKAELIGELADDTVSFYRQGDFVDLCAGPHLPSTGRLGAFKLLHVAGAYWRGDEHRPMLQRIYGTAFATPAQLEEYLHLREEARRRDHRKLGRDLDLVSTDPLIGPGLVCWHPMAGRIRTVIEDFWRQEHYQSGYEIVYTPHIGRLALWERSGHTSFYRENMYAPMEIDEQQYLLRPMNCPFHIQIYQSRPRSYRELPIRWAELGTVYRYERAGVLHGLLRVRGFTQDDAHIFCTPEQLDDEIAGVLDFTLHILRTFGFDEFQVYLSTRPDKFVGTVDNWERATEALQKALESSGLAYEEEPGGGVFYGPKIDVKIRDALRRVWQCSTIQVDFNIPERFEMTYVGRDGAEHQPIMIHRALMGSLERFFGCLLEHYGGDFPLWLAPVQVIALPITEAQNDYGREVVAELRQAGFRAEIDLRNEKIGAKIREATLKKVPVMLVIGKREEAGGTVSVRLKQQGDQGSQRLADVIATLTEEVASKQGSGH